MAATLTDAPQGGDPGGGAVRLQVVGLHSCDMCELENVLAILEGDRASKDSEPELHVLADVFEEIVRFVGVPGDFAHSTGNRAQRLHCFELQAFEVRGIALHLGPGH